MRARACVCRRTWRRGSWQLDAHAKHIPRACHAVLGDHAHAHACAHDDADEHVPHDRRHVWRQTTTTTTTTTTTRTAVRAAAGSHHSKRSTPEQRLGKPGAAPNPQHPRCWSRPLLATPAPPCPLSESANRPRAVPCETHACLHTDMHTYMHTCLHTCLHTCMHTCMHAYMHTHVHTCMHTCSGGALESKI